jgi:hypothetical protein
VICGGQPIHALTVSLAELHRAARWLMSARWLRRFAEQEQGEAGTPTGTPTCAAVLSWRNRRLKAGYRSRVGREGRRVATNAAWPLMLKPWALDADRLTDPDQELLELPPRAIILG